MKKLLLTLVLVSLISISGFAVTIDSLFNMKEHVKEVSVQGEVIGDVMIRGNNAWINIKDETNAIGLWTSRSEAEKIAVAGDYKHTGDWIKASGLFNKQCNMHGGDTDIHVSKIEIVKEGSKNNIEAKPYEFSLAIISFILFASLYLIRRYISRRRIQL